MIGWIPHQLVAGGGGADPTLAGDCWDKHRYLSSVHVSPARFYLWSLTVFI